MFTEKDSFKRRTDSFRGQRKDGFYLKTAEIFDRRRRAVRTGIMAFAVCMLIYMSVCAGESALLQQKIAAEVLRFHVLANSDSRQDQAVKYQVRDAVLTWLEEELEQTAQAKTAADTEDMYYSENAKENDSRKKTMQVIEAHLREIEAAADRILEKAGMDYRASAEVTRCYFPERTYGSCTFAAGWYDALRIRLGKAKGQNWWCVLYPRLCFQDCLHAVVEEEQLRELEEVLTVEEYESLLEKPQKWKVGFRWF